MEPPRCFISYSWDSELHRKWVRKLATRLRECGINAILDQFHCALGTDLTKFMEKSVRESNFVLLVCTPNFAHKAEAGLGGVGYEKAIVTGEIFAGEARDTKFVPLLREGDAKESLPSYLKNRLFVDFREDGLFETKLEELLRHFHGEPFYPLPPLGAKPDWTKPTVAKPAKKPAVPKAVKKPAVPKIKQNFPAKQKITNSIGMEFVLIPAGRFKMGSFFSPEIAVRRYGGELKFFESEHPQHDVKISKPFYLQTKQVTVGQWRRFMRNTSYITINEHPIGQVDPKELWLPEGTHWDNPPFSQNDSHPVTNVLWGDIVEFIRWLDDVEGDNKYRLPTEAEWEYSCRAGTTTAFSFGDDPTKLSKYAWYGDNSGGRTHPVGKKNPNAWGLYDMHGNLWEWVEDNWHNNYHRAPADGRAWIDELKFRKSCVRRGGCWRDDANRCRSASRAGGSTQFFFHGVGFRLAMSVSLGS